MVANLICFGKESYLNVLLLLGFCRLHKMSHSKFECSHFQEVISWVLTQMMHLEDGQTPKENYSPTCIYEVLKNDEEEK